MQKKEMVHKVSFCMEEIFGDLSSSQFNCSAPTSMHVCLVRGSPYITLTDDFCKPIPLSPNP